MWGFGDSYWQKFYYEDCVNFCKNNDIEFSINPEIVKEGAAGMFLYRNKESIITLRKLVEEYNSSLKVLKDLGSDDDNEYKEEPGFALQIQLDRHDESSWPTFLHEIGHYFLWFYDIEQSERHADHFRLKYFKDKPKWMAWQERESLKIYAHVKIESVYKFLGLNPRHGWFYNLQNVYYKSLHKRGKWSFL